MGGVPGVCVSGIGAMGVGAVTLRGRPLPRFAGGVTNAEDAKVASAKVIKGSVLCAREGTREGGAREGAREGGRVDGARAGGASDGARVGAVCECARVGGKAIDGLRETESKTSPGGSRPRR